MPVRRTPSATIDAVNVSVVMGAILLNGLHPEPDIFLTFVSETLGLPMREEHVGNRSNWQITTLHAPEWIDFGNSGIGGDCARRPGLRHCHARVAGDADAAREQFTGWW